MMAAMFALYPVKEIVFSGRRENSDTKEMLKILNSTFMPQTVSLLYSRDEEGDRLAGMVPYIKYLTPADDRTTVYVCENFACKAPITDKQEFAKILE